MPFDSLPQILNPKGGYIQNENSSPGSPTWQQVIDWTKYPSYIAEPSFSLRSQMATTLIDTKQKLSLEDVIRLKHSLPHAARRSREERSRGGGAGVESVAGRRLGDRRCWRRGTTPSAPESRGGHAVRELVAAVHARLATRTRCSRSHGSRSEPADDAARAQGSGARRAGVRAARWTRRSSSTAATTSRGATSIACAWATWTCRSAAAPARSAASAC